MNWLVLGAFTLGLNAASPEAPEAQRALEPPSTEALMTLPAGLAAKLEAFVTSRGATPADRYTLLIDFMFGASGMDFRYDNFVTRSVPETFDAGVGNCLSFTMLFIAAARHVGLEAGAREVRVPPEWSRQDSTIYRTGHVNVGLLVDGTRRIVDFEPDMMRALRLSSPFRGRTVSDGRMFAHYYNNRAAELLGEGRIDEAWRFVERAIGTDPEFAPAWNTRGVVLNRLGRAEAAEAAFLEVLERQRDDPEALINLFNLYRSSGDRERTDELKARLESTRMDDPYFQFELGEIYENQGDFARAERHFRRAIGQKGDEDRFHFALARILFLQDDTEAAERALIQAIEASAMADRAGYKHKLQALRTVD